MTAADGDQPDFRGAHHLDDRLRHRFGRALGERHARALLEPERLGSVSPARDRVEVAVDHGAWNDFLARHVKAGDDGINRPATNVVMSAVVAATLVLGVSGVGLVILSQLHARGTIVIKPHATAGPGTRPPVLRRPSSSAGRRPRGRSAR